MRTLALLVALSVGCDVGSWLDLRAEDSPRARAGVRRDPDTIIVGRPRDATSLDPARVSDNESVEISEQIYDKLLTFKPGSTTIVPGLAVKWEASANGRVWTFYLRRNVRFHDGTPFNADSVVFSLERQRDPSHPFHRSDFQYWKNNYQNIVAIEAVDDYTVQITIEEPFAPLDANMAMFPVAIVSPAAVRKYGHDYGEHPVGTGPFRFVRWEHGARVVLERNEGYWAGAPTIKRLVFQSIPDGRQRLIALEGGAIDIVYSIVPDELQFVALHPELELYEVPANNVSYLAMNTTRGPFVHRRVRRALNHAIHKEAIIKLIYQGRATIAHGPVPPTQWGYHRPATLYAFDPSRARQLLAEAEAAGQFDPEVVYQFHVPSEPRPYLPDPLGVARVVRANLADVGVKTELISAPFDEHLRHIRNGEHDICLAGWVIDNGDPDNVLYVLLDRDNATVGSAQNVAFFDDPEVHGLLNWAQQSQDKAEREQYYARAQDLIHSEAPWVPIAHSKVQVAARKDVGGIVISPMNLMSYRTVFREP